MVLIAPGIFKEQNQQEGGNFIPPQQIKPPVCKHDQGKADAGRRNPVLIAPGIFKAVSLHRQLK